MRSQLIIIFYIGSLILGFFLMPLCSFTQNSIIHGKVSDAVTGESMPGVNIIIDTTAGGTTDNEGFYEHHLPEGHHILIFKYIGYRDHTIDITLEKDEVVQKDILLHPVSIELNTAVISASRYEQRLSDVTVSMEVIPKKYIESISTRELDKAISTIPGVDIIDGQANIRGGSGYSFGAGSRVLVLLDDLPILEGGVNDVKWDALPLEIVERVEIIKGASSALYGTSALNGVISLHTISPGIKPLTRVELSGGAYMKPGRKEMAWFWDHNPFFGNLKFSHLRKSGPVDISIGGSGFYDEGYRQSNDLRYLRFNTGIRYTPAKLKGLSLGVNSNFHTQSLCDFLIWQDADSGAYMQNPEAITPMHGTRLTVDPYVSYFDARNGRHSLKTRYFNVTNKFDEDEDKNNRSDYYFSEYQYQKTFRHGLHWSIGAAFSYTEVNTSLYGNHSGSTQALYTQLDHQFFDRLSASLGVRWERYTLDRTDDESKPVFRTGINYQLARISYIRASFGQGYRYPSMAEKYTSTSLGGLKIFPSPALDPESGWSAEVGIKQGIVLDNWRAYIDIAAYWMEYTNMIEFIFGVHNPEGELPSIEYIGFKSINTEKARINGVDISLNGQGNAGSLFVQFFAGYTYMNPLDLSEDSIAAEANGHQILKYRYRHSAKADVEVKYKKLFWGLTSVYSSFMKRIDAAFEENILGQYFFPGLKEYRIENNKGAWVFNLRAGWNLSPSSKISIHINNLFNKEYMGRPGDIQAPQNLSLQYLLKIN
ncbi:MAG: TonB-dependent receptor [Bacteroidota bacterium]